MTDPSATERRRAVRRIILVQSPLIGLAGAAALYLQTRVGLRLPGGLPSAEINLSLGFAVLLSVMFFGIRAPFLPPHRAAWPPTLVFCAVQLRPAYMLLEQFATPSVLRWPGTLALGAMFLIPVHRQITRYFRRALTEIMRIPANQAAAAVMVQECASMAADPRLTPERRKVARLNQARALVMSAEPPTPGALLAAVQILEELAVDPPRKRLFMFQAVLDLARAVNARGSEHGDLTGYLDALDLLADAAERMPEDEGTDAYVHMFMAEYELAYATEAATEQDAAAHAAAAADSWRHAIKAVTPEVRQLLPELYAYLGMCTAQLADERDRLTVLEEAIGLCRQGVHAAGRRPRRRAPAELALAGLLELRALELAGRLTDDSPEAAEDPIVADLREAHRLCARMRRTGTPEQRRDAAEQLASVRSAMDRLGATFPESTVAALWRRSATMSERGSAEGMVRVHTQWVDWAESTDDPQWCAEAYESLLAVIPRVAASRYLPEERDRLLANVQDKAEEAGYWLSRNGQFRDAAVALERGRAVAVSELSSREDSAFERVHLAGPYHDLAVRLREATDQLTRAERQAREHPEPVDGQFTTPIQRAWSEFDAARREIVQVLGFEPVLPVNYWDIADAVAEGPLVYLACASRSGYALIIGTDLEPNWLALPMFSRERVEQYAYRPYRSLDSGEDYSGTPLNEVLRWLWENGIAQLADQLPDNVVATLVPMGVLGLLPIHAAGGPVRDGDAPADWDYLIDHVAVRYTANARMQTRLRRRAAAAERAPLSLLAFDAPTGDPDQPLATTQAELDSVCRHWPQTLHTRLDGAVRDETIAALNRHTVWHFAGHCEVKPERIRSSALLLEDARLTLDDLSAVSYEPRRLAVLSACRSHRSGDQLPDEVVGMPTVLLLAGFAGVLATHWNIGDGSAAFVAARFYQAWREERCAPTEALRRAQRWVRHATREELNAYLPGILPQTDSPSAVNAHVRLTTAPVAAERPFAQPRSWAPFSLTGV